MTITEDLALASAIVDGIKTLIAAYEAAKSGSLDPAAALAGIATLQQALAATNAAVDAAAHAKFDTGGS